ncbi:hypothetical protein TNCV_3977321 [Trichonephila clavipes]|nr:hypothetical protein TNCV_3977321 [Trichonephila clavipes]
MCEAMVHKNLPKKTFVQLEVLSLGTYDAVSSFNMGISKLEILRKVCIEPGDYGTSDGVPRQTEAITSKRDCVYKKQREVRKEKKDLKGRKDDELLKNADDLEYGAGMF